MPNPTVKVLQNRIMKAAAGQPLKTSITQEKIDEEGRIQKFIFNLLMGSGDNGTESKETTNAK